MPRGNHDSPQLVASHYLVFSQDGPEVHLWPEGEKGWPSEPIVLEGMDGVIALPEVGATIHLSEIYARAEPKAVNTFDGS